VVIADRGLFVMSAEKSYGKIVKSTSIMGGAGAIVMLMGLIRTKFAAVLIGSVGVGVITGFLAVQGLINIIAGLGIQSSAVREIAVAKTKGDDQSIGRIVLTLRRISWLTGMAGMLVMMILSPQLSSLTFNSNAYTLDIAALGIVILLANLTAGKLALLQGMRRIGDMARVNIAGSVFAALIAVIFYYSLGQRGIVTSLVSAAAIQLLIACYFARRIHVPVVELSWMDSLSEAKAMVKLGLVFMWNGLLVCAVSYFTIPLITQSIDLRAVGLYSAAFTLSGISVNFVLGAMGADYYPRLTAVAHDKASVNRLVNEQTEIGLLLALPGLLATLVLAPWLLQNLYTTEFLGAVELLQWFAIGCLWRVVSWPLGFVMLALGKGRWFLITETSGNLTHLALIIIGLKVFGIEGVAVAFCLVNFVYIAAVHSVCRHLTGFTWSVSCFRIVLYALPIMVAMLLVCRILPTWSSTLLGSAVILVVGLFCLRELAQRLGSEHRIVKLISSVPFGRWFFVSI